MLIAVSLVLIAGSDARPWITKVVGSTQYGAINQALVRFEQPLEHGKPAHLYLVRLDLDARRTTLVYDAYDSLPAWDKGHPTASDVAREAEAKRLRQAAWKRASEEIGMKRWTFEMEAVPVPATGPIKVSLAAGDVEIQRRCEQPHVCELFVDKNGDRVVLARGIDFANVYVGSFAAFLVALEAVTRYEPAPRKGEPQVLHGVHAFRYDDLNARPVTKKVAVGDAFFDVDHLYREPVLDSASEPVGDSHVIEVRSPPKDSFAAVRMVAADGTAIDGYAYVGSLRRELTPSERALRLLKLDGGLVPGTSPPRYRLVAKNPTTSPLTIAGASVAFSWGLTLGHRKPTSDYRAFEIVKQLPMQTVAPGNEVVLVDADIIFDQKSEASGVYRMQDGGKAITVAAAYRTSETNPFRPALVIEQTGRATSDPLYLTVGAEEALAQLPRWPKK